MKLFARARAGGRLRARGRAGADRGLPPPDADGDAATASLLATPERRHDHRHRGDRPSGSGRRARSASARSRPRCRWPGRSPTSPAGSPSTSPRSSRTSAWCRRRWAPSPCRPPRPDPPGAVPLARRPRRDPLRGRALRLRPGDAACCRGSTCASAPGERVGLVGHSGAGKSTMVNLLLGFFRPEEGRILDRRAGHRRGDAGIAARRGRRGDPGHGAAAPLDPRQHPLRPAGGDGGGDRGRRRARRGRRLHPRAGGLARPRAATTRMWASAA